MTNVMNKQFDTIIIGGGHNGLVCAAYLARAGQKVCLLEAADKVGGAAVTDTFMDGFRISSGAQFLNQLHPEIVKDLKLESHGLAMAASDIDTIALSPNGEHMTIGRQSVSGGGISDEDKAAYSSFMARMSDYAGTLAHLIDLPPIDIFNPDWDDKKGAMKLGIKLRFGLGKEKMQEFLRIIGINMFDVLTDEFDSDLLKGALSFDAVLGTHAGPRTLGSVLTYLYRIAIGNKTNRGAVSIPKGGMGAVSDALAKACVAAGVDVRTSARVGSVLVENCRVSGVTLDTGEVINAHRVASNADPKATVFNLVGPRHFEADFVKGIDNLRVKGTAAKLHLALKDLPEFTGLEAEQLKGRMVIAPSANAVERAFNHAKYGEVSPEPMMEFSIPSISDDSLTDGGHVLNATVQYAPYHLKGGWTEAAKNDFMAAAITRLEAFAPDIRKHILVSEMLTPADIEARFGMAGGHWSHGEMALDQMLMMRPTPGAARYSLPLDGMYLCGAGAHPGGGVMGAAGRNAAKVILKGEGA